MEPLWGVLIEVLLCVLWVGTAYKLRKVSIENKYLKYQLRDAQKAYEGLASHARTVSAYCEEDINKYDAVTIQNGIAKKVETIFSQQHPSEESIITPENLQRKLDALPDLKGMPMGTPRD